MASLAATRRTKFSTSRMGADSAITSRFCGAASSVMSLMVATTPESCPSSSNIWVVRITTSRSMPLSVCRRTVEWGAAGVWFRPTSTPHPGSQTEHLKISWQCFPSISSEVMPKSFSAARLTPVMRNSGSYKTSASESWSNTDSKTLGLLPAWGELRHSGAYSPSIPSAGLGQLAQFASFRGARPPTCGGKRWPILPQG